MQGQRLLMVVVGALAFAGCGGVGEPVAEFTPAPPGEAIYSLAVHPTDGTLVAATGPGFYRLGGAGEPELLRATLSSAKGNGAVDDLVVRYTSDGTLIGSGHAVEPPLPENIGLARSTDQGKTWKVISGQGEADYHELEVAGERLLGLRTDAPGTIMLSTDGGRTFDTREAPTATTPVDIAVNPADPTQWAVSNDSGTFISTDEGRSWRQRSNTPRPRLVWADALYGIGLDGTVRHSADGGRSWQEKGTLGTGPKELVAAGDSLYAITTGGQIQRSRDGGATWQPVAKVT